MSAQNDFEKAFKSGRVAKMMAAAAAGAEPDWSHLALAAQSGSVERLRALLELGLEPSAVTLQCAAGKGNIPALEALVQAGIGVNDGDPSTALHHAAMENKLEALTWLIERGANTEAISELGYTPLEIAVRQNAKAAARRLVEAGAKAGPDAAKVLKKWGIEAQVEVGKKEYRLPEHRIVSFAEARELMVRLLRDEEWSGEVSDHCEVQGVETPFVALTRKPDEDDEYEEPCALEAPALFHLAEPPQLDRISDLVELFVDLPNLLWKGNGTKAHCMHLAKPGSYAVLDLEISAPDGAEPDEDAIYGVVWKLSEGWAAALLPHDHAMVAPLLGLDTLPPGPEWREHKGVIVGDW